MLPYIKLPELQLNTKEILSQVLSSNQDDWEKLEWGQSIFKNLDCTVIKQKFHPVIQLYETPMMVMRFSPGTGLPIHKDNRRKAVIQIPLYNCESTPTFFYDEDHKPTYKIDWSENCAYMFDTHVNHNLQNDTNEERYMLFVPFFIQSFQTLSTLYRINKLFLRQQNP